MNERELIEETVGGSIERIKKELVHILVDDEEIKSLIISECGDILNERLAEELENIKNKLHKKSWAMTGIAQYRQLLDLLINDRISELKENKDRNDLNKLKYQRKFMRDINDFYYMYKENKENENG